MLMFSSCLSFDGHCKRCLFGVSRHKPFAAAIPIVCVKVAVSVPLAQIALSKVPPDRALPRRIVVLHVAVAGVPVNNVSVGARAWVLFVAAHFHQVNHFASSLPANPALVRTPYGRRTIHALCPTTTNPSPLSQRALRFSRRHAGLRHVIQPALLVLPSAHAARSLRAPKSCRGHYSGRSSCRVQRRSSPGLPPRSRPSP